MGDKIFLVDVWLEREKEKKILVGLGYFLPGPTKMGRKLGEKCSLFEQTKILMCKVHMSFVLCQFASFFSFICYIM